MENVKKYVKNIIPRKYQEEIYKKCKSHNSLIVLPTGLGKTLIALMLAIDRICRYPESKILFVAPTRPLAEQHFKTFKESLPDLFASMELFTGSTKPKKRQMLWNKNDIIFSTPQCVEGKTRIFTEKGPISIEKFFEKFGLAEKNYGEEKVFEADINEKILGYKNNKINFVNAVKALKFPVKHQIEIKTEQKNCLKCTPEHPLLTITSDGKMEWKRADEFKKGDYIASINEIDTKGKNLEILPLLKNSKLKVADVEKTKELLNLIKRKKTLKLKKYSRFRYNFMPLKVFLDLSEKVGLNYKKLKLTDWQGKSKPIKIPKYLNNKISYIVGAMLGDGHIGNRDGHGKEVVFSDLDNKENQNHFKKTIFDVFGIKMKEKRKGLVAYNSALAEFLSLLGVQKGKKSSKIKVPQYMFSNNVAGIQCFLKGVFDTDGHASKHSVSISSASKKFIQDIKWLCLKLKIVGSIDYRINSGNINRRIIKSKGLYTFRFSGKSNINKFVKIDPEKTKCKKLFKTIKNTKRPYTRSKEIIPVPELVKNIYKKNPKKFERYLCKCLSKDNLNKIANVSKGKNVNKLRQLLEMPIRWVKIKEIKKKTGREWVYDFTVKHDHNFITNTIISHNCINNDLEKMRYKLNNTSLLIEDEAHRCVKNYAYTKIAKKYKEQAKNQRIVGMTASPGSDKQKLKKICENLSIETIEHRNRKSEDVKEYIQEREFEIIKIDFPKEFKEIEKPIKKIYDKKVGELKNRKLLFGNATRKNLIQTQNKIMSAIQSGNKHFNLLAGASATAMAIKLQHALELLETQTLYSLKSYMNKIFNEAKREKSKASQKIAKKDEYKKAYGKVMKLLGSGKEHPKIEELKKLLTNENKENSKFMIFCQMRDTATKINQELNKIDIKSKTFVGQTKKGEGKNKTGLSQKEQQQIIREFSNNEVDCLVATSIGEEGLDIPEVNAVIFYEPIPSAIRSIQRRGRTARLEKGKLFILMTKGTRDEAYYWSAFHKEKKMHHSINNMKRNIEKTQKDKQEKL